MIARLEIIDQTYNKNYFVYHFHCNCQVWVNGFVIIPVYLDIMNIFIVGTKM